MFVLKSNFVALTKDGQKSLLEYNTGEDMETEDWAAEQGEKAG